MIEQSQTTFPSGELVVKTNNIGTTDQLRMELPLALQQSDELTRKILTEDALIVEQVGNWGISAKSPTSGYTETALMLVATDLSSDKQPNHTDLIYDAPPEVQRRYWEMTTDLLFKANDLSKQDGHPLQGSFIFLTGHHNRYRQYDGYPSARSINLHHDHLLMVPPSTDGKPYLGQDMALPVEQDMMTNNDSSEAIHSEDHNLLPYNLENFTNFVNEQFDQVLTIRDSLPHGYSFMVSNPEELSPILDKHFKAYKAAMEASEYLERVELDQNVSETLSNSIQHEKKKGHVEQPAFTLYLLPHENHQLEVIISPMLVGVGGPERAGILLRRGPDHPARFSDEQRQQVIADLKSAII